MLGGITYSLSYHCIMKSTLCQHFYIEMFFYRKRKIIDGFIGSIVFFEEGRVIINFNYREEPVTATIGEIIAVANKICIFDKHLAFFRSL